MNNILRELSDKELKEKVKGLIVTHENIDEAYEKYCYGILDTFDHCLTEEEAEDLLYSLADHNLVKEQNFIEFMKAAYVLNDNEPVIVNFPFQEIESSYVLNILNMLDYIDRIAFIDQLREVKTQSIYHTINSCRLLELFTKMATRELYFPIFHFTKLSMTIVGNFDLSFPIFCRDKENLIKYKNIAEKCGLFIRDIIINDDKGDKQCIEESADLKDWH